MSEERELRRLQDHEDFEEMVQGLFLRLSQHAIQSLSHELEKVMQEFDQLTSDVAGLRASVDALVGQNQQLKDSLAASQASEAAAVAALATAQADAVDPAAVTLVDTSVTEAKTQVDAQVAAGPDVAPVAPPADVPPVA